MSDTKIEEFKMSYDWEEAMKYGFRGMDEIKKLIACDEGENDDRDWIAVLKFKDGQVGVLRAGCDYTGWDCHASGDMEMFDSVEKAISSLSLTDEEWNRLGLTEKGYER